MAFAFDVPGYLPGADGHSAESPHLYRPQRAQREQLAAQIQQLPAEGRSQRQIAERVGVALGTVNKVLKMGWGYKQM